VLLQKLIFAQLFKKYLSFYGTPTFTTVFTRTRHWTVSYATWMESTSFHTLFSKIIFHMVPGTRKWSLPFRISDKNFLSISHRLHVRLSHPPGFNHLNYKYLVSSKSFEASLRVMLSIILLSSLSCIQIFTTSAPSSQIPLMHVPPLRWMAKFDTHT
jgi:hypothetical protein